MQRILSLKLLSKTINSCKTNPIPLKTTTTSLPFRHFFSEYSTWSSSPSNRAISDKISHGFCSNPVLAKHFLRNSTLKDRSRTLFNGVSRVQISRRIFHSFDVTRHSGGSAFRRLTVNGVLLGLIITNVAVFLLWSVTDKEFMKNNFMISLNNIKSGRVQTLITSAFSHMDVHHLIGNMLGLYFFGRHLGGVLGPEYLLKLYFAGALAGSVFFLLYHAFFAPSVEKTRTGWIDSSRVHGLGASGAVNAIMLLSIFLFPRQTIYLEFIIPVPAYIVGVFIIGYDLLRVTKGDSHVSGASHLGGVAVAALSWYQIRRGSFRF